MPSSDRTRIQRLLAAEFERRGWAYDLSTGATISEAITREGEVRPQQLARLVSAQSLSRQPVRRSEIAAALERALAGVRLRQEDEMMKILFIAAGPVDELRLRLDAEHRDIRARLRAATHRDRITMESALAARATDLIDELNRHRPTILHFAGHGDDSAIAMEDADGTSVSVQNDQLKRLIGVADRSLRLVVLNSCESAYQAEPLIEYVDAAIGMGRKIGDDAARALAAQLYSSLAEGVPLGRAFEQAVLQVSLAGEDDTALPRLFTRSGTAAADLVLVSSGQ